MPTFTGKTFSTFYKNILGIDQTSNTGVDAITRVIHDGAGNSTAISLSDDELKVKPVSDDTITTFTVANSANTKIFAVDTTNSKVLVNAGQVAANTNYAIFGANYQDISSFAANTHYPIPFVRGGASTTNDVDFGTGTDPDDSFTTANTDTQYASQIVPMMWRLPDNITISSSPFVCPNSTNVLLIKSTHFRVKSFLFSCLIYITLFGLYL
mgnify:CR=1 FL=1